MNFNQKAIICLHTVVLRAHQYKCSNIKSCLFYIIDAHFYKLIIAWTNFESIKWAWFVWNFLQWKGVNWFPHYLWKFGLLIISIILYLCTNSSSCLRISHIFKMIIDILIQDFNSKYVNDLNVTLSNGSK